MFQQVLHDWCNKGHGMCYPVCGIMHIKECWLEREIAQWVHPMKDLSDDTSHYERTPLPQNYLSLLQLV